MELINKEDAVALIKAEMDKIRTHSLVDGTARINLRLAKNIIEDMPTIDLADYVPKDFHDKTCEAMAKAHQEEIADMVSVVRCKECRYCKRKRGTFKHSKNGRCPATIASLPSAFMLRSSASLASLRLAV